MTDGDKFVLALGLAIGIFGLVLCVIHVWWSPLPALGGVAVFLGIPWLLDRRQERRER